MLGAWIPFLETCGQTSPYYFDMLDANQCFKVNHWGQLKLFNFNVSTDHFRAKQLPQPQL